MTGAQANAFQAATGQAPSEVSTLIAAIFLALVFLWAAWVVWRVLASLVKATPDADQADLIATGLRTSLLIAVALYVVL